VAALVNGIGSIGPVIQEEVIGWLMSGQSYAAGMRNANYLALVMSVLLVGYSLLIFWLIKQRTGVNRE